MPSAAVAPHKFVIENVRTISSLGEKGHLDSFYKNIRGEKDSKYYSLKNEIHELNNKWFNATALLSSTERIRNNEYYKKIIAKGDAAIPIILEEIYYNPSQLVWALNDITKQKITDQPVNIIEACNLWVKWGVENKLIA